MERPHAILFDVDGTLVETGGAGGESWRLAFHDLYDIDADVSPRVAAGSADRGVLVCGSGVGATIAANKVHGIRACLCHALRRPGKGHPELHNRGIARLSRWRATADSRRSSTSTCADTCARRSIG